MSTYLTAVSILFPRPTPKGVENLTERPSNGGIPHIFPSPSYFFLHHVLSMVHGSSYITYSLQSLPDWGKFLQKIS